MMPISSKMYLWGDKAKYVPEESGVYALYDKNEVLIYIGESRNLREQMTQYLKNNFNDNPCKNKTKYYQRELTTNYKERWTALLEEYKQEYGQLPLCNIEIEKFDKKPVGDYKFYFYEDVGKPLGITALNPKDFGTLIREIPVKSLEFHQKRGDFAKWILDVFGDINLAEAIHNIKITGKPLKEELLHLFYALEKTICPNCAREVIPSKTWKMTGKPSKSGMSVQLTIGFYRCHNCDKAFRRVIEKEKIQVA